MPDDPQNQQVGLLRLYHLDRPAPVNCTGAKIVQNRLELAAEDHMASMNRPADFDFDRLGGVVADALGVDLMIVPADDAAARGSDDL